MIPLPFSPRLLVIGGSVAALLIAGYGLYFRGRTEQAAKDRAAVTASQTQARVSDVTAKAVDRFHTNTVILREAGDLAKRDVEKSPGAADTIDPDRRATLCASLASVRHAPVCDPLGGDSPASAPRAVHWANKPDDDAG